MRLIGIIIGALLWTHVAVASCPSSPADCGPITVGNITVGAQTALGTWTTATRPANPSAGWMGANTSTGVPDYYNGASWTSLSTSAPGCLLTGCTMTGAINSTYAGTALNLGSTSNATIGGTLTLGALLTGPRATITGTPSGSISLALTQVQTLSASNVPGINIHETFGGAITATGGANSNNFLIDNDAVNTTGGSGPGALTSWNFGLNYSGTATGGRTAMFILLNMTANATTEAGNSSFYSAFGAFSTPNYWQGGSPGAEAGAVFGSNPLCVIGNAGTIGGRGYRGCTGEESDVGLIFPALTEFGFGIVKWATGVSTGWRDDDALFIGMQTTGSAVGFKNGVSIGNSNSGWPILSNGEIFTTACTTLAAGAGTCPVYDAFDLRNVNATQFTWVQTGAAIDGSGDMGGASVYGTALYTSGPVQAQTAAVNAITVASGLGGEFESVPNLTVSASPGGGTQATASVATMGLRRAISIVGNAGTGYATGTALTVSGGTCSVQPTATPSAVTTAGAIIDFTYTPGSCSVLPSNPITLTGGAGTGAEITTAGWTILTVAVGTPGTLYPAMPPPLVTTSAATKIVEPIFNVTMTAGNATLALQPSGGGLSINGTAGVSCAANTISLLTEVVTNGIVTHC